MACQCERSNESNLSQALQMINGLVVHNKLRHDTGCTHQMIAQQKSNEEIITTLYLAALPPPRSWKPPKPTSPNPRTLALEDIGWAILNSKEFLFQH